MSNFIQSPNDLKNFDSGSDGTQIASPSNENFRNVTNSSVPQHPVGSVLDRVAHGEQRSLTGSSALQLTAASFKHMEHNLAETKEELDKELARRIKAEQELAVLKSSQKPKQMSNLTGAFLTIVGSLWISQGMEVGLDKFEVTTNFHFGLGFVCLLVGLFAQFGPWKSS